MEKYLPIEKIEPHFVGSFDIQDYVFFFFRENAVEYINCGKNIYSRVARICKGDMGGKNILAKSWATYLKARLNCSIPGEFPFYFNEIRKIFFFLSAFFLFILNFFFLFLYLFFSSSYPSLFCWKKRRMEFRSHHLPSPS